MSARSTTLRAGVVATTAVLAVLPLAGIASAAPAADLDCNDFPSQAAAQAALIANPTDPNGLDRDHDGKACESLGSGGSGSTSGSVSGSGSSAGGSGSSGSSSGGDRVTAVPAGSVDAGDGSAPGAGPVQAPIGALVLTAFGAVVGAGAACAVRGSRRTPAARTVVPRPRDAGDDLVTGRDAAGQDVPDRR